MSRFRHIPPPLPPRPERYDESRQSCPGCGCPDAEVLFQVARCLNPTCRNFDPALEASCEAGRAAIAVWFLMRHA